MQSGGVRSARLQRCRSAPRGGDASRHGLLCPAAPGERRSVKLVVLAIARGDALYDPRGQAAPCTAPAGNQEVRRRTVAPPDRDSAMAEAPVSRAVHLPPLSQRSRHITSAQRLDAGLRRPPHALRRQRRRAFRAPGVAASWCQRQPRRRPCGLVPPGRAHLRPCRLGPRARGLLGAHRRRPPRPGRRRAPPRQPARHPGEAAAVVEQVLPGAPPAHPGRTLVADPRSPSSIPPSGSLCHPSHDPPTPHPSPLHCTSNRTPSRPRAH